MIIKIIIFLQIIKKRKENKKKIVIEIIFKEKIKLIIIEINIQLIYF